MGFILKKIEKYMGPPLVPYDFFFCPFIASNLFFFRKSQSTDGPMYKVKTRPKSVVCKPKQIKKTEAQIQQSILQTQEKKKAQKSNKRWPKRISNVQVQSNEPNIKIIEAQMLWSKGQNPSEANYNPRSRAHEPKLRPKLKWRIQLKPKA